MQGSPVHALLIGIDGYARRPLSGCVNDVNEVDRWLSQSVGVAPGNIVKLTAPRAPGAATDPAPTESGIRAALAHLAGDQVKAGDRVFIYYSGHGFRDAFDADGASRPREALVPVDAIPEDGSALRFVWDVELNALLQQIAARGAYVTVVLDCCHAAGAVRSSPRLTGRLGEGRRFTRSLEDQIVPPAAPGEQSPRVTGSRDDGWAVVVGCRDQELARESDADDGRAFGVFTSAFLAALRANEVAGQEATVRWGDVWPSVLEVVGAANPDQNPQEHRAWGRPVLGGPDARGDMGWRVRRDGASDYILGAGRMHDLAEGALVAVYGPEPTFFPPLGEQADLDARKGVLRVVAPERSFSKAEAHGGLAFDVPDGARARLISSPAAARLAVRAVSADAILGDALAGSVLLRPADQGERAEVWIETCPDGYAFGDDLYDVTDASADRGLVHIPGGSAAVVRAVLEHYRAYSASLRMLRRAERLDVLTIDLIGCADPSYRAKLVANGTAAATPIAADTGTIDLVEGDAFCIRIASTYERDLQVTLLSLTIDGQVEPLGAQVVAPGGHTTFWFEDKIGSPFTPSIAGERRATVERLVAVGTTSRKVELDHLRVDQTFDDIIEAARPRSGGNVRTRGDRPIATSKAPASPPERWTGAVRRIRIARPA